MVEGATRGTGRPSLPNPQAVEATDNGWRSMALSARVATTAACAREAKQGQGQEEAPPRPRPPSRPRGRPSTPGTHKQDIPPHCIDRRTYLVTDELLLVLVVTLVVCTCGGVGWGGTCECGPPPNVWGDGGMGGPWGATPATEPGPTTTVIHPDACKTVHPRRVSPPWGCLAPQGTCVRPQGDASFRPGGCDRFAPSPASSPTHHSSHSTHTHTTHPQPRTTTARRHARPAAPATGKAHGHAVRGGHGPGPGPQQQRGSIHPAPADPSSRPSAAEMAVHRRRPRSLHLAHRPATCLDGRGAAGRGTFACLLMSPCPLHSFICIPSDLLPPTHHPHPQ